MIRLLRFKDPNWLDPDEPCKDVGVEADREGEGDGALHDLIRLCTLRPPPLNHDRHIVRRDLDAAHDPRQILVHLNHAEGRFMSLGWRGEIEGYSISLVEGDWRIAEP
jgi:hypothetical protein